jgi:hypothetical protein
MIDFLKEVGDSMVVDATQIIIYIEKSFFDDGLAIELGEKIETTGLFYIGVKYTPTGTEKMFRFTAPVSLAINFKDRFSVTTGFEGADPVPYECARLLKGDIFVHNLNHVQDIDNAITFLKVFNLARIPRSMPYNSLVELYKGAASFNGINFRVPSLLIEVIISELCRKATDNTQPFRLDAGKGKTDGYKMIPIKKIAEVSSVFNAISFENLNQAIQSSVSSTRSGKKQRVSPIEKTIFY